MLKLSHGVMFRVPIEVPDRDPLVGDLVSSPEKVGSSMEKREDAVLGMDISRLEKNGARENAGSGPGEGMGPRSPEWGTRDT